MIFYSVSFSLFVITNLITLRSLFQPLIHNSRLEIEDATLCPRFYPGYKAIIDSSRTATADDYVLIYFSEQQRSILGRLTDISGQQYLLAHATDRDNINLTAMRSEEYVIQGVVVNTIMGLTTQEERVDETITALHKYTTPQVA